MKKRYYQPEIDIHKFSFEQIMDNGYISVSSSEHGKPPEGSDVDLEDCDW